VPEEVSEYAESIVMGEAEGLWPEVVEDFRNGRLPPRLQTTKRPAWRDSLLTVPSLRQALFAGGAGGGWARMPLPL